MNGASGRTEGRAHRQSRDNQKFFNSMGYQIFLGMGLLSGALDAQELRYSRLLLKRRQIFSSYQLL